MAGIYCACQLRAFAKLEMRTSYEPLIIFEEGDDGRHELTKLFKRYRWQDPYFRPGKTDRISKDGLITKAAIPLQAADLLAYNLFDMNRKLERDGVLERRRPEYEIFDAMLGTPQIVQKESVAELEAMINNEEFLNSWMDKIEHENQS